MEKSMPYELVLEEASKIVRGILEDIGRPVGKDDIKRHLEEPPTERFGDVALPCFRLSKKVGLEPLKLANRLLDGIKNLQTTIFKDFRVVSGYLNFYLNMEEYGRLVLETLAREGEEYGLVKVENPLKIVVEHTSANPIHPLHIGHARNSIIGDTLYRMLKARGHIVYRRFFINDMGRQVALLAYGYRVIGKPPPKGKPDVYFGKIYSITNVIVEIDRLKKEIKEAEMEGRYDEVSRLKVELDEWIAIAAELKNEEPELFNALANNLVGRDHEGEISKIMREYELRLKDETIKDIRSIVGMVIEGFKETLSKIGVEFDFWDWESEISWGGYVDRVLEEASKSPHLTTYKGAPAISFDGLQEDRELREALELPKTYKIPPLILRRSDGTTLYTTRDLAYSIFKFEDPKADRVINVIMSEQRLPQLQIRLALAALGYREYAKKMIHYSYEIVTLPGQKISSRRGRYVSLDSLVEESISRAREIVEAKGRSCRREEISKAVGVGALRYALVSVSASKPLVFKWDEVLDFEKNSGPYLQYTHARASSILRRAEPIDFSAIDYKSIDESVRRRRIIKLLGKWPSVFVRACEELKPELIVDYLASLSDEFNSFYNEEPVLREEILGKRMLKLGIILGVKTVIGNALKLLGIEPLEEM